MNDPELARHLEHARRLLERETLGETELRELAAGEAQAVGA